MIHSCLATTENQNKQTKTSNVKGKSADRVQVLMNCVIKLGWVTVNRFVCRKYFSSHQLPKPWLWSRYSTDWPSSLLSRTRLVSHRVIPFVLSWRRLGIRLKQPQPCGTNVTEEVCLGRTRDFCTTVIERHVCEGVLSCRNARAPVSPLVNISSNSAACLNLNEEYIFDSKFHHQSPERHLVLKLENRPWVDLIAELFGSSSVSRSFPLWFCVFIWKPEAKAAFYCTCTSLCIQLQVQIWNALCAPQPLRVMIWKSIRQNVENRTKTGEKSVIKNPQHVCRSRMTRPHTINFV